MKKALLIGILVNILLFVALPSPVFADSETLRPNGVGTYTEFDNVTGSATHWGAVDEVVADNDATKVFTAADGDRDTYALADHVTGSGTINSVTVYVVARNADASTDAYILIYTNAALHKSALKQIPAVGTYQTISNTWSVNPATSSAWTWTEIDALEAGQEINETIGHALHVTQVYVSVNYSPLVAPTVSTSAATLVEETTATLNGSISDIGGENADERGFDYGLTASYGSEQTTVGSFGTGGFSEAITGLSPGTLYHFRAKAHNSIGWGYGSDQTLTTKPLEPTNFIVSNPSQTTISLSWAKGTGATRTMIRRKTSTYPTGVADGSQAYYDTGNSIVDSELTPGTQYLYRAWSWVNGSDVWSDSYAEGNSTTSPVVVPSVNTNAVSRVSVTTARLNAVLNSDGGNTTTGYIYWGTTDGGNVTGSWDTEVNIGTISEGTYYTDLTGLVPGTLYYFRAKAENSAGTGWATSSSSFTTGSGLGAPSNFLAIPSISELSIQLNWTLGANSTQSQINFSATKFPDCSDSSEGTAIFSGDGNYFEHSSLTTGQTYRYTIWSVSGNLTSTECTQAVATASLIILPGAGLTVPTGVGGWMASPDPTALEDLEPFYSAVNGWIDEVRMPRETGWLMAALGLCVIVGLAATIISRGNLMATGFTVLFTLIVATTIGLVPMWMAWSAGFAFFVLVTLSGKKAVT